ncbi:hypothetical protein P389DRAFT_69285 [Cystobasidium minutum MCA 4210]|uniref:uncharacterized protein n=1 Tax=Cystobasidium minutum MCA 4210 TaxID=1397322 RepID=UPI0034CD336A|eukprot:jgi/Rhomi1/69285/CE69284_68
MTTNAADNLLCKQDDDRQNDISQGPAALEKLLGWRVNLKQLALAALAYQTTRTLQLVRRRQQAMPAATTMKSRFDFSRLPEEVFDLILEEARLAAIDHATSNNPVFDSQLACSCTRAPPPAVQFHVYTDMDDRRGIGRFGSHSPHRGNLFEHNLDMSHNYRHVPPKPDICRTEGKCLRAIRADLKVLVSSLTSSPESSLKESKPGRNRYVLPVQDAVGTLLAETSHRVNVVQDDPQGTKEEANQSDPFDTALLLYPRHYHACSKQTSSETQATEKKKVQSSSSFLDLYVRSPLRALVREAQYCEVPHGKGVSGLKSGQQELAKAMEKL